MRENRHNKEILSEVIQANEERRRNGEVTYLPEGRRDFPVFFFEEIRRMIEAFLGRALDPMERKDFLNRGSIINVRFCETYIRIQLRADRRAGAVYAQQSFFVPDGAAYGRDTLGRSKSKYSFRVNPFLAESESREEFARFCERVFSQPSEAEAVRVPKPTL